MALTLAQALEQLDPSLSAEAKEAGALALMLGSAANDVYWAGRSELEQLKAQALGHGIVQRGGTDETPTRVEGIPTAGVIEGKATNTLAEPAAPVLPPPPVVAPAAAPDNPAAAIALLRKQLTDAGITPEA